MFTALLCKFKKRRATPSSLRVRAQMFTTAFPEPSPCARGGPAIRIPCLPNGSWLIERAFRFVYV